MRLAKIPHSSVIGSYQRYHNTFTLASINVCKINNNCLTKSTISIVESIWLPNPPLNIAQSSWYFLKYSPVNDLVTFCSNHFFIICIYLWIQQEIQLLLFLHHSFLLNSLHWLPCFGLSHNDLKSVEASWQSASWKIWWCQRCLLTWEWSSVLLFLLDVPSEWAMSMPNEQLRQTLIIHPSPSFLMKATLHASFSFANKSPVTFLVSGMEESSSNDVAMVSMYNALYGSSDGNRVFRSCFSVVLKKLITSPTNSSQGARRHTKCKTMLATSSPSSKIIKGKYLTHKWEEETKILFVIR